MRVTPWLIAALLAAPPAAASAPARDTGAGRRTCTDITGYLDDPAPAGRAVHAAPDAKSPVLGRIAAPWRKGDWRWAVSFAIKGSQDGWLLVEGAGDDTVLTEEPARPMYGGEGWIRGEGVSVGIQASQGFAAPSHASEIIVRTAPNELDMVSAVVACDGNWVLAQWRESEYRTYRYKKRAVVAGRPLVLQAWATGICNIQETSCDMAPGDRPAD